MNMQDILDDLTKVLTIIVLISVIIAYTFTLFILLFMTDGKVKHLHRFIWGTGVTVFTVIVIEFLI
ncbi:hypothetical protein BU002_01950 [Mammaliicoccus sciuri]|nr:hypothetical protein BU002_01950 [Mammaliicoccus sciuri]